ncbi:MAG: hypothetical protein ACNA71_08985, partial [Kiritimatiellia bacterium]
MQQITRAILFVVIILSAGLAMGQEVVHEDPTRGSAPELDAFRARVAASHPGLELDVDVGNVAVPSGSHEQAAAARIAVFVKNQTTIAAFNDEVDPLRDVIGASLAGSNLAVIDAADVVAGFHR